MRGKHYCTIFPVGQSLRWLACVALGSLIIACSSQAVHWQRDSYVVREGDTLYAIAWRAGVDHRALAKWNSLGSGDVIYPGQRLRLKPPRSRNVRIQPAVRKPAPAKVDSPPPASESHRRPPPRWHWPTRGKIIASFGDPASVGKGIDIAGERGQPVVAAAAGRVVYAGSGLVGYGKLIIVKHNETYLSAYGHNETLLAAQGEEVEYGQRIAEMGLGPDRKPMLHFEIRANGMAVDPVRFLPKR